MTSADCFLLCFYRNDIFRVIEELKDERKNLNIHVIHNNSSHGEAIDEQLNQLLGRGHIDSHSFFHNNIAAAAFGAFFDSGVVNLKSPFTIISDGDIMPSPGWLSEHVKLLNTYPDIFSVSMSLDLENAPNHLNSAPKHKYENKDFLVQKAGWVFKTFRRRDWRAFRNFSQRCNLIFHNGQVDRFGEFVKNKQSVVARKSIGRHMRWDFVDDLGYLAEKNALGDPWRHNKTSSFKFTTRNASRYLAAMPARTNMQFWKTLRITNKQEFSLKVSLAFRRLDGKVMSQDVGTINSDETKKVKLYCPVNAVNLIATCSRGGNTESIIERVCETNDIVF